MNEIRIIDDDKIIESVSESFSFFDYETIKQLQKEELYIPIIMYQENVTNSNDPVLSLSGLGREIWIGIDPDQYIEELRKGWE